MKNKIKKQISKIKYRPPIYGKKTLRVALEFGVVLSEVAKKQKIELTEEITVRAENILIQELKINGLQKTVMNFTPLVLAALEV